jgi:type II secretory pathway component HofQ
MTEQLNDETKERLMKTAQHITPLLPEELLGKALFWLFFIVLVLTPNNSWTQVSSGARELANVTGASERNARRLIQQNSPASNQRVSVLGLSETEHTVQSAQPLTLDFQDIEVRRVLQLLADLRDINLVVSESVTGNLSLRLKNISWDDALETILRVKNLAQRRYNNVMIVAPKSEVVAQEKSDLANARGVETLAPLETQLFRVRYGDAKGMLALINLGKNSILSKRGHGVVDERTNSLIVVDIAPRLEAISEVIEKLDIPLQQVPLKRVL